MNDDKIEYKGCTIEWSQDDHGESPRKWDNLGVMVCWHGRWTLGDEQPKERAGDYLGNLAYASKDARYRAWFELSENSGRRHGWGGKVYDRCIKHLQEHRERVLKDYFVMLPLYLYDHSGITMRTHPFDCKWDSGQVGYIYATLQAARNYFGESRIPQGATWDTVVEDWDAAKTPIAVRDLVTRVLEGEVQTYDDYITGNVRSYEAVDGNGDTIDSCCGFYPHRDANGRETWDYVEDEFKAAIDSYLEDKRKEEIETCACHI